MTTPSQPGGVPDPSAYQPPSGAYPPAPGSVPTGGVPSAPGGYPAPSGGYPAPSTGYPAPSEGYPAPSGGYPPAPGAVPPPGSYPPPPGGVPGGPVPMPPGAQPPKKKNKTRLITAGVVLVVVIVGIIFAVVNGKSSPANAKVGDCINYASESNVKVVDCSSSDAEYKVVSRVDGTADTSACENVADSDVSLYTKGDSSKQYTLCVALVVKVGDCVSSDGDRVACTDSTAKLKVSKVLTGTTDKSGCPADSDFPRVYTTLNQVTCFQSVTG